MRAGAAKFFIRFLLALSVSCIAFADAPVFTDASQRIMSIVLKDGLAISDGIPMYPVGTQWYVPIGELSQDLGLNISIASNLGKAQGYVLEPDRRFVLDLEDCTIEHDDKLEVFNCDEAAQFENDIYVTVGLLNHTLPLSITINSFRSEMTIDPRQKLPAQLQRDREKQVGAVKTAQGNYDPKYPRVDVPNEAIDGGLVDQQFTYTNTHTSDTTYNDFYHDTTAAGELLGMEASGFLHGTATHIQQERYTLARRDPDGQLLGPFKAKDIELIDITIPSIPLVGGGGIYRGALISNYDLLAPNQFGAHDFVGDLPNGWEVELYQNDTLVDRRSSAGGRYEFRNIPLLYGPNRFRLAFYGPQGQRRENFETYSIDSSFLKANQENYRFAIGDTQLMGGHLLAQFDRSLADNLTLISAFMRTPPVKDVTVQPIDYAILGARAFTKDVLFSTTASATEQNGYAWENAVQGGVGNGVVGGSYARLSNFTSEIYPIEQTSFHPQDVFKANTAFNLLSVPATRVTLDYSRTYYQEGGSNDVITQKTTAKIRDVVYNHTFTYDQSQTGPTGELATVSQVVGSELRTTLDYNIHQLVSVQVEAQKKFSDGNSITAGVLDTVAGNIQRLYASATKQFSTVTLSANASMDNMGTSTLGAILSYAFAREPREKQFRFNPKSEALAGAASVFVYLDVNQNGRFDLGDRPLPNVEIRVNQTNTGLLTDPKGVALLTNLTPYQAADLSIALRSLEDPFQKPSPRGLRIYPRPGKIAELELPVIISSELTGFARTKDAKGGLNGHPHRNLLVQLKDSKGIVVHDARTEVDGYFLLEDLRMGKYTLQIDPDQLKSLKLKSEPTSYEITINSQGLLDNVKDFIIENE